jgi:TonB family protein
MPGRLILGQAVVRRWVHLGVAWQSRGDNFRSSLLALLHGPAPPQGWPVGPFFRTTWLRARPPWKTLSVSALWHVLAAVFPFFTWTQMERTPQPPPQEYAITWSAEMRDLLPYLPPGRKSKTRMPAARDDNKTPPLGADAYHPRQTIISAPKKITHPRQTLIQPDAPPQAPKILPALPNVAQWTPAPARRRLSVDTSAKMRARVRKAQPVDAAPLPDVKKEPVLAADVTLAADAPVIERPKLEVNPTARPRYSAPAPTEQTAPAPEAAPVPSAATDAQRLVALSTMPAPPPPKLEVPPGNLGARFAISPEGKQPGVPGGAASSAGNAAGISTNSMGGGGKGKGIPGISIGGGNPDNTAAVSGAGGGLAALNPRPKVQTLPDTRDADEIARARSESLLERMKPGAPPEKILEPGEIYTLHVNMPNLASATGSWVLKFAEIEEEERKAAGLGAAPELSGPVPLRKVDPKYPPALMSARIQGEVILYAIIRRDGSVDSIQLIQGLDPQLDENAMVALSRWKFRAAERKGKPVELETIVRIPFHAVAAVY